MIKEAFLRSLMSGKSFVDEIYNEIFMSGEPTPPKPPVEYEYPTFSINNDGDLIATYLTDNRELTFSVKNNNLYATYSSQNPNLYINQNGELMQRS